MFVFLAVFLSLEHTASAQDFNTRLVTKLSEMMGVPTPKMRIEVVSQKELLDDYRSFLFRECMSKNHNRFETCRPVDISGVFVHGIWIPEKDGSLHVKVHKNSGMDALIHEFCHWYLNQVTPFLNNHTVLETIVGSLLSSPELLAWLEKEQR